MTMLPWVDAVIAFTLLEGLALVLYFRVTRRGVAPSQFAWNMAAGVCLMLAVRLALVGAGAPWLFLALFASGVCHGTDLWRRWQR